MYVFSDPVRFKLGLGNTLKKKIFFRPPHNSARKALIYSMIRREVSRQTEKFAPKQPIEISRTWMEGELRVTEWKPKHLPAAGLHIHDLNSGLKFTVDTGSVGSFVCLTGEDYNTITGPPKGRQCSTVSSTGSVTVYKQKQMTIKLADGKEFPWLFNVGDCQPILGIDFLCTHFISIDFINRSLSSRKPQQAAGYQVTAGTRREIPIQSFPNRRERLFYPRLKIHHALIDTGADWSFITSGSLREPERVLPYLTRMNQFKAADFSGAELCIFKPPVRMFLLLPTPDAPPKRFDVWFHVVEAPASTGVLLGVDNLARLFSEINMADGDFKLKETGETGCFNTTVLERLRETELWSRFVSPQ